jgi:GTP-binding protein
MNNHSLKTVALVGRPNVGKSTLFNRLVGSRIAIESPIPGTTRDRLYGEVSWQGNKFDLMDLAGVETGTKKEIDQSAQESVDLAITEADLIIFLVDWSDKNNDFDKLVARKLRKYADKVLLVVNKVDNPERMRNIEEFKRLGSFDITTVSAISGKSTGDLLEKIIKRLGLEKSEQKAEKEKADIDLSIIGRPNVGKSTLLNAIIGEKRAIVSSEAGTTRDIVDVKFMHKGKSIVIQDTAGIRRPGKVSQDTIESYSVLRTYKALRDCDVAVLVIDGLEGLVALDMNILGKAKEWGKGIILAVNKIDTVTGDKKEYMARKIWEFQEALNFVPWMPIVFISAKEDENVKSLLGQVVVVDENRRATIPR